MDFLRNAGCEKAQGYLIGRPQPYSITRRDLVNSGYTFEQEQLREYYDNLGLVNLLSNRPLEYDLSRADESDLAVSPWPAVSRSCFLKWWVSACISCRQTGHSAKR